MLTSEDVVLRDSLLLVVTAPLWLARLTWLVAAGAWNDWRAAR